jgi:hypothetical protein
MSYKKVELFDVRCDGCGRVERVESREDDSLNPLVLLPGWAYSLVGIEFGGDYCPECASARLRAGENIRFWDRKS